MPKDTQVVLLDEPTAALDTKSEVVVREAMDHLVRRRTVVVIAQWLSTVVGADQIVVIEDGKVAQRGRHADLLADSNALAFSEWCGYQLYGVRQSGRAGRKSSLPRSPQRPGELLTE